MSGTKKITTTRTNGWMEQCQQWAQAEETFEIHGIGARHLSFCKQLCEAYRYACSYHSDGEDAAAHFFPDVF